MTGAVLTKSGDWDEKIQIDKKYVNKYLNNTITLARSGSIKEINSFVVYLSNYVSFCKGSYFLVDGGQSRIF
jgi:hypothetical protein